MSIRTVYFLEGLWLQASNQKDRRLCGCLFAAWALRVSSIVRWVAVTAPFRGHGGGRTLLKSCRGSSRQTSDSRGKLWGGAGQGWGWANARNACCLTFLLLGWKTVIWHHAQWFLMVRMKLADTCLNHYHHESLPLFGLFTCIYIIYNIYIYSFIFLYLFI